MREAIVHLVVFVAAISTAALLVGVLVTGTAVFSQSVERDGDRSAAEIATEIEFVNDPAAGTTYDQEAGTVTLLLQNVGDSTLEPEELDVLVNGDHYPVETTVLEGDRWRTSSILEATVDVDLAPGDHRALATVHGVETRLSFEHRIAFWEDPADADCTDGVCTVENDTVDLPMTTDPSQEAETVTYSLNDTSVASLDPEAGETDADGTHETELDFDEEATVEVTLDVDWDEDTIVVSYEEGE